MIPDVLPVADLVAALPRLRRYARVLTGDVNCADDLAQYTLTLALEKRRLWPAGSDLRAWLFTHLANVHANQISLRQRRLLEVSIDGDESVLRRSRQDRPGQSARGNVSKRRRQRR